MMSSLTTPPSAPDPSTNDYVLGHTGDTVVYIFPTGDALMNRDAANAPAALVEYQQQAVLPAKPKASHPPATDTVLSPEESALIDRLLADGSLTVAQLQVARYDQAVAGVSLVEALTLRGWL